MKIYAIGIRMLASVIFFASLNGFFIFKGNLAYLYWPGLIGALIVFVALLYSAGWLLGKSKA